MTVNGVKVLDRLPMSMHNANLTTLDQGRVDLSEPVLWMGQTKLEIDFEQFSGGVANDNARFQLIGLALVS